MVQEEIALVKFCCNAAIAVSSLVFVINCCDFLFDGFVFICLLQLLQMIIKGCAGQLSD